MIFFYHLTIFIIINCLFLSHKNFTCSFCFVQFAAKCVYCYHTCPPENMFMFLPHILHFQCVCVQNHKKRISLWMSFHGADASAFRYGIYIKFKQQEVQNVIHKCNYELNH